jgi:ribose-phosphate pyrophosphokinase
MQTTGNSKSIKAFDSAPESKLGLIVLKGCTKLGSRVDQYLTQWRKSDVRSNQQEVIGYVKDSYILDAETPRFGSGEAKGQINATVRGYDLYIMVDVTNYSLTYTVSGHENHMSPDDHYQDLKRIISAASGKAKRITVIMPFLYEGRQHRRSSRESLDCACMLQELVGLGVDNIITFDAHDPRVQNAIPNSGFDSFRPAYQFIKAILNNCSDLKLDSDHLMIVSPDEGATDRAVYLASVLGVNMGMFYKRRDYTHIVDGRNPIVAHEFLGDSVEGKDVWIIDDMISSGDSIIDVARQLKKRKANRIFMIATFGLFTNGMEKFDQAYKEGIFYRLVSTNLTYQPPEFIDREYIISCDMSKFISYIVDTLNHDESIGDLMDPYAKIEAKVKCYNNR